MRLTPMYLLALLSLGIAACKGGAKISDKNLREMSVQQVRGALAEPDKRIVLVDARPADQFAAGHLPGAMNLWLPDVKAEDGRLKAADRIIVYAAGWQDPLGPATAKRLMALNYHNVYLFRGGMDAWNRGGQATEPATAVPHGQEDLPMPRN